MEQRIAHRRVCVSAQAKVRRAPAKGQPGRKTNDTWRRAEREKAEANIPVMSFHRLPWPISTRGQDLPSTREGGKTTADGLHASVRREWATEMMAPNGQRSANGGEERGRVQLSGCRGGFTPSICPMCTWPNRFHLNLSSPEAPRPTVPLNPLAVCQCACEVSLASTWRRASTLCPGAHTVAGAIGLPAQPSSRHAVRHHGPALRLRQARPDKRSHAERCRTEPHQPREEKHRDKSWPVLPHSIALPRRWTSQAKPSRTCHRRPLICE